MPELLIVGGLTVDRFADGTSAPGGSVLHAGRAARADGARVTTLTVAGDELEARDGLSRLHRLGAVVHQPSSSTITYRHDESGPQRVLVLERAGAAIGAHGIEGLGKSDVALLAPIADELPVDTIAAVRAACRPRLTVMLIQGWLRRLVVGEPVRPRPLDDVADDLWAAFGAADAIVVSTEDLADGSGDPFAQAAALRSRLGRRPLLVLTLGPEGYLLDDPAADRIVASVPRTVVTGVPMVGAGDTFGASLGVHLGRGTSPLAAADAATERVIAVLEARR